MAGVVLINRVYELSAELRRAGHADIAGELLTWVRREYEASYVEYAASLIAPVMADSEGTEGQQPRPTLDEQAVKMADRMRADGWVRINTAQSLLLSDELHFIMAGLCRAVVVIPHRGSPKVKWVPETTGFEVANELYGVADRIREEKK
jgi:hypothetical protein